MTIRRDVPLFPVEIFLQVVCAADVSAADKDLRHGRTSAHRANCP
ncbi:hypothetical protein GGI1_15478 [Acidithiobacillus sp. GGI-221]|nr:hypothetical protein GGI1_15478 [Acidithiobacillus sp. GGI-221]